MAIEEGIFELRRRIATMTGQRAQAETELMELKNIPCPGCSGKGNFEEEQEEGAGSFYRECVLCGGSGKACGQRSGY